MLNQDLNKQTYRTQLGSEDDEVIIGDSKSASFVPQITFTKWQGENSLTLKPAGQLAIDLADIKVPTLTNGKVEVRADKIGWYANPDGTDNLKFGLILYEKPQTNTWSFIIDDGGEFNFYKQPPLTEEFKVGDKEGLITEVTETHCYDKDGKEITIRPENVVGSYAVYHKSKSNNQYKTGKFCHIYRPKFIDTNGDWVWGKLEITNGIMKEICPQEFLDKAMYPVKSNATYGDTNAGGSESQIGSWRDVACAVEGIMSENGTPTSLHISFRWYETSHLIYYNYWGNDNNKSSAADGASTYGNADNLQHWYQYNISGDLENSGSKLYVGYQTTSSPLYYTYDSTAGTTNLWNNNYDENTTLPSARPTLNAQEIQAGVYIIYTPSGGEAAVPRGFMTTNSKIW